MDTLTTCRIKLFDIGTTIGDKLKYYRLQNNITQDELAKIVGFNSGACIKDIELGIKLPGREISKNLALRFKLDTKYFFDTYLEETDAAHEKLKSYRTNNNLTIKQAANKFDISATAWSTWESKKNYISRDKYKLLKKLKLL